MAAVRQILGTPKELLDRVAAIYIPRRFKHARQVIHQLRSFLLQAGALGKLDSRAAFERWALSTYHDQCGWVGQAALDRTSNGQGYINAYIQGCWTVWSVMRPF